MTYPEQRYREPQGNLAVRFHQATRAPEITYANGNTVHYLATGATTEGLFGLYRWVMGNDPSGADPHFHRTISESFYVLSGSILIYDGNQWREAPAGDFAHVPPGGIHGFRNESGPASMLIHFAPGAPRESYFEGLMSVAEMTDAERSAFFLQHDNHWVE